MGQRSQIYIRYNITDNDGENYRGIIAKYYRCNYGLGMVSRARYLMDKLAEGADYPFLFGNTEWMKKVNYFCDINFDEKSIEFSDDIVNETRKFCYEASIRKESFGAGFINSSLFGHKSDDGQLYIDVTNDGIKYCFTKNNKDGIPMDAERYLEWDFEDTSVPDWRTPSDYRDPEDIAYTEKNLSVIEVLADVMTADELNSFLEEDYTCLFDIQEIPLDSVLKPTGF